MAKIFVAGAEGQLGKSLVALFSAQHEVLGVNKAQLDISQEDKVYQAISSFVPDLLINAAAYTDVDTAGQKKAYEVNVNGALYLAKAAQHHQADFIHFSTDYVFNGQKKTPYIESDVVDPINDYGKTKSASEERVLHHCSRAIVMRISWLFGENAHGFPQKILHKAMRGESIAVVDDQIGGPTYVHDVATASLGLYRLVSGNNTRIEATSAYVGNEDAAKRSHCSGAILATSNRIGVATGDSHDEPLSYYGIYHFAGYPYISWYDFAVYIVTQAYRQGILPTLPTLHRISSEQLQQRAKRPHNSCLDTRKIQAAGIVASDWQKALHTISAYV